LSLNVNKANYLLLTKSKEKISLQINDSKIKQADCVKYLYVGVYSIIAVGEQSSLGGHNKSARIFKLKHFQLY